MTLKWTKKQIICCLSLVLAMVIYSQMLTTTIPYLQHQAGGLLIFDMRPTGYSVDEAKTLLLYLSDDAKQYYMTRQLVLDLFYPGLFALFGFLVYSGIGMQLAWVKKLRWLPVIIALSDYVENIGIFLMLNGYDHTLIIQSANAMTLLKSSLTVIHMILLLILSLTYVIVKRVKGRANR